MLNVCYIDVLKISAQTYIDEIVLHQLAIIVTYSMDGHKISRAKSLKRYVSTAKVAVIPIFSSLVKLLIDPFSP